MHIDLPVWFADLLFNTWLKLPEISVRQCVTIFNAMFEDCWVHSLRPSDAHIYVDKLIIIGSNIGLSPGRRQAIIWTKAGILLNGPLGTNFSEISIAIQTFSLTKIRLKMLPAKCCPFCLSLNVLNEPRALRMESWLSLKYNGISPTASTSFCISSVNVIHRDQSKYVPSQWEMLLHCNSVSHWLGPYLDWSLHPEHVFNELKKFND